MAGSSVFVSPRQAAVKFEVQNFFQFFRELDEEGERDDADEGAESEIEEQSEPDGREFPTEPMSFLPDARRSTLVGTREPSASRLWRGRNEGCTQFRCGPFRPGRLSAGRVASYEHPPEAPDEEERLE